MASYNTYGYRQDKGVNAIRGRGPTDPGDVVSPPSVTNPDTNAPVPAAANPFLSNVGEYGLWGVPSVNTAAAGAPGSPVNPAVAPVAPTAPAAVFNAAEAYRNLPATATSADRNVAMQNYANALREDRALAPAAPAPIDRYQAHLARQGINPNTIGTAEINRATGALNVPSPIEETVAANLVNKRNALYGAMQLNEMLASADIRSSKGEVNPAAMAAAEQFGTRARELQQETGVGKYERAREVALADLRRQGAQRATKEAQEREEMTRRNRLASY